MQAVKQRQPRRKGWRDRRAARLLRLRQDQHAAHDRRLRGRDRRRDPHRRQGDPYPAAGAARRRDGVRGLFALSAAEGAREYRLRAAARARRQRRHREAREAHRRAAGDHRHPRPLSDRDLRWAAAAHLACPRADPPRAGLAARRADVAARAATARHPARAAQGLPDRAQDDDGVRDPRPDRGDRARRPHRGDGKGRAATVRHAGRDQAEPEQPVRRQLHRRAADEHFRRRHRAGRQRHVDQRPRPERATGLSPESTCRRRKQRQTRAPWHPSASDRDRRERFGRCDRQGHHQPLAGRPEPHLLRDRRLLGGRRDRQAGQGAGRRCAAGALPARRRASVRRRIRPRLGARPGAAVS